MSKLELELQFEIGQDVMLKGAAREAQAAKNNVAFKDQLMKEIYEYANIIRPQRLTVIGIFIEICPGGLQKNYRVRGTMRADIGGFVGYHPEPTDFEESELEAYGEG